MGIKIKTNLDMKKLEKSIKEQARNAAQKKSYEVECPHCHTKFHATPGNNVCPHCHENVNLDLKINF